MSKEENKPNIPVILELFEPGCLKEKNDGGFKTECPDCGLQGGRTEGFIIYPETNGWYCHSSGRHGGILELVAIKHKIIKCIDCLETGEKRRVLEGEQFKEVMDVLQNEYPDELYKKILSIKGLKQNIQLPNDGKLVSTFADELGKRLKVEEIFFYRPEEKKIVEIGKIKHPDGKYEYSGFIPVDAGRFVTIVERYFHPWKNVYTKWGKMEITTSMPTSTANLVLVSDNFREQMPVVNRIFTVPMPIIYEGKLTFPEKGYDKRFGSWMAHNAPIISNPNMTLEEAKNIMEFIHREFCYQNKQDFTHAIARIITPFCRGLYPRFTCRTPLFVTKANRQRAGKDYHEGITSILYEGVAGEEPPISNSEHGSSNNNEELRKKVMSALIAGRKKMHFSNNKGFINNAVFEGIITAEHYSDRILGSNTTLSFPNELEFSLSGNVGMSMTPDLFDRSRSINLFLDIEDSNTRKFHNPNLHGWVMDNRSLILSAIYAFIRNWVEMGMPSGSKPFTSYPDWAKIVGGIMEAAGYDSPCEKENDVFGSTVDAETSDIKALFEFCYEKAPEQWIKKMDIKEMIINSEEDIFPYIDWDKKSDQIKFGIKLNKYIGRIFSDIKMKCTGKEHSKGSRCQYCFTKQINDNDTKKIFNVDLNPEMMSKYSNFDKNKIASKSNMPKFEDIKASFHVGHDSNVDYAENYSTSREKYSIANMSNISNMDTSQPSISTKNDRDVQFWESQDTIDIISKDIPYTEQVLEWIKNTPEATVERLYEKFGIGVIKVKNDLIKEGKIKQDGLKICLN